MMLRDASDSVDPSVVSGNQAGWRGARAIPLVEADPTRPFIPLRSRRDTTAVVEPTT
jgi:hypothetical protein